METAVPPDECLRAEVDGEMRNGSTIADIGQPAGYPPSIFYDVERQQVRGYSNYFQNFQP